MNLSKTLHAISVAGLSIASMTAQPVTFSEHIAPIIFNNCTSCHRPGEAAPFPLMSYEDVAKRGRMIAAITQARYMPPWKAEPGSYAYLDERRLNTEQIALIQQWVADGMAEGDRAKLPPLPDFPVGWQLGEPDLIVEMPAGYTVPGDGPDIYRNFVIPLSLPEDKWLRAIEQRPSARSVVHHVLFSADATSASRRADEADPEPGYSGAMGAGIRGVSLGGWALGQQPHLYPEGIAMPLAKGSDLLLQYHFHPAGKTEVEKSVIGLYFAGKAPERSLSAIQLPVLFGYFSGIDIPPGEKNFRVQDSFVLPVDVEGVAITAHAHYIGKEMKMTATLPSGEEKILLWIKDWNFAWQDRYYFQDVVPLPSGTRLSAEVSWDNSADNPHNPSNPPARVKWGEQSTDEMGSVILQVLPRQQSDLDTLQRAYRQHLLKAMLGGNR
jgi:hypothetical protein